MLCIMKTTVKRIPVVLILEDPRFADMVAEYAAEAKIPEMPTPKPDSYAYQAMERFGHLVAFGAYTDGGRLVGFLVMLVSSLPHYSLRMAVIESFYVLPSFRRGGSGQRLLRAAEDEALQLGCHSVLVTAPNGGRLARALPVLGYRPSHEVFIRRLQDE